jgi:hypothetical protein
MNAPNTKLLSRREKDQLAESMATRVNRGIMQTDVARVMGYKSPSSVGDLEHGRVTITRAHLKAYMSAVNQLCARGSDDLSAMKPTGFRPAHRISRCRVTTPIDPETMRKVEAAGRMIKNNNIPLQSVADEMGTIDRPITDGMVSHFGRGDFLTPTRAAAYIAAVEKLCAAPQISITIPAPVEPQPEPPAVIPVAAKAPNRPDFVPLAALLILAEYAEDSDLYRMELKLRRVGLATMIGRDDQSAWDAAVASAASVTVSSLLNA